MTDQSTLPAGTNVSIVPPKGTIGLTAPIDELPTWRRLLHLAGDGLHLFLMAVLLYLASGAVCEIFSRNEDYNRVQKRFNLLVACQVKPEAERLKDKTCEEDLDNQIKYATKQLRLYESLNSIGVNDRCSIAAVIASPRGSFQEDCIAWKTTNKNQAPKLQDAQNGYYLAAMDNHGWWEYSGLFLRFDERPKDHMFFFLVLVAAAVGALMRGLRAAGFTTLRDLALGLGTGFAVFLLLRGGNFVFFSAAANVDALNPFTAGAAGLLAGLLSERTLALFDGAIKKPAA